MVNVLLIGMDAKIVQGLAKQFPISDFTVHCAFSYESGLEQMRGDFADLVCVDINRCEADSLTYLKKLRGLKKSLPILVIAGSTFSPSYGQILELGLADYVLRPYHISEIIVRMKNLIRVCEQLRGEPRSSNGFLRISDDFLIDFSASAVIVDGQRKHLPKTLKHLLFLLLKQRNKIVGHRYLQEKLWGDYFCVEKKRDIRTHAKRLRALLGLKYGRCLKNVRSQGYILRLDQ